MILKDQAMQEMKEGEKMILALSLGQVVPAVLVKIDQGLGLPGRPGGQPVAHVQVVLALPIAPGGILPGAIAWPKEEAPKSSLIAP